MKRRDDRQRTPWRGCIGRLQGIQQCKALLANSSGIDLAFGFGLGQPAVLDAPGVALISIQRRSHCGSRVASLLSAARSVSATNSSRLSTRMAASTCVASVRCCPRALSKPRSRQHSSHLSSHSSSCAPPISRPRNSLNTEKSKPGSLSSNLSRSFQSMRPRTASVAWRSARFLRTCKTVTRARRHGAGRPQRGKSVVKSSSS
jgi:hypothetical protein